MPKATTALFIGRFQPFHLGHLAVVELILQENEHLTIAVGTTQESRTEINPFTFEEREAIIKATLEGAEISPDKYNICPLPDINDYGFWPIYVTQILRPYHKLYTGSQTVKDCYLGKHSTPLQKKDLPKVEIIEVKRELPISGTKLRHSLVRNQEEWHTMVHPAAIKIIEESFAKC